MLHRTSLRRITTGEYHQYEPGIIARGARKVVLCLPTSVQKAIGRRLRKGLEEVKRMEDEAAWLRAHGNPLVVMGLPEEGTDAHDVKTRYRELTLTLHPDQGGSAEELQKVQKAYAMLTNAESVYYLSGMSPDLALELGATQAKRAKRFGYATIMAALIGLYLFGEFVVRRMWEGLLYLFDPTFYAFMLRQEQTEREDRARGVEVDTNPYRLAPEKFKKIAFPGRYIHAEGED